MSQSQALTQQATNLAVSTPKELDLTILVREVADTKTNVGISLRGKHGEQNLFSGVCKLFKSMNSIPREDKLPDSDVKRIKDAISAFWNYEFTKVMHYGEIQSITYDKPSCAIKAANVQSVSLNARIHVARELDDGMEKQLFTNILRNQAVKRLSSMKERPDMYERKDYAKQEVRIAALEREYDRLVRFNNPTPEPPAPTPEPQNMVIVPSLPLNPGI